ncbi:hypothetical protein GCM10020358_32580 [Amorphoplanes nipponensis]|uniref:Uncharacterized protein n=1 Tax=Actinoplanes nipponensis TaxID=135950 RepID=A0A919JLE2_9ACTN|nr:hypothetical protein [Actinoplanes nipponensis]GIE51301.1 hypothetical protein Ani05nite_48350 [Actinoplanes nipponensis]
MIDVERPVWLLDVDGVVNTTRPGWGAAPRRSLVWSAADNTSYVLRWAPPLIDRIRRLHDGGRVEVRWCTTWCPESERLERLWRLPELARALHADPMPRGAECWPLKLAAARAVLAEGRRLVWTDDEALPPPGPERDELAGDGRALLIAPRPLRGLQPADLDLIEKFAAGRRMPTHRVAGRHRLG